MIAAGNIGCMVQIAGGTSVPVVHTIELLDWATGGPRPELKRSPADRLIDSPRCACGRLETPDPYRSAATGGPRWLKGRRVRKARRIKRPRKRLCNGEEEICEEVVEKVCQEIGQEEPKSPPRKPPRKPKKQGCAKKSAKKAAPKTVAKKSPARKRRRLAAKPAARPAAPAPAAPNPRRATSWATPEPQPRHRTDRIGGDQH